MWVYNAGRHFVCYWDFIDIRYAAKGLHFVLFQMQIHVLNLHWMDSMCLHYPSHSMSSCTLLLALFYFYFINWDWNHFFVVVSVDVIVLIVLYVPSMLNFPLKDSKELKWNKYEQHILINSNVFPDEYSSINTLHHLPLLKD